MAISDIKELFERGLVWKAENSSCSEPFSVISTPQVAPQSKNSELGSLGIPELDSVLPGGGWKKGVIHEFFYAEKNFISPPITIPSLLASRSSSEIFWIGKKAWPTPFFLERLYPQQQDYKEHCFFIDPPDRKTSLWSIETILRGAPNCCVIADCSLLNFILSRRLSLAAEGSNSMLILLRDKKYRSTPSSAVTRWEITSAPSSNELPNWRLDLLQCRGKEPSQKTWIIEEQYGETISVHLSAKVEGIVKSDSAAASRSAA